MSLSGVFSRLLLLAVSLSLFLFLLQLLTPEGSINFAMDLNGAFMIIFESSFRFPLKNITSKPFYH